MNNFDEQQFDHSADEVGGIRLNIEADRLGLKIDRTISEDALAEILAVLFGSSAARGAEAKLDQRRYPLDKAASTAISASRPAGLTLGEFIDDVHAKTFVEKICATAYFLDERGDAGATFSRHDVKAALESARATMPANFTRDFNQAVKAKYIASDSSGDDRFHITRTGMSAVDAGFPAGRRSAPRKATAKSASRTQ